MFSNFIFLKVMFSTSHDLILLHQLIVCGGEYPESHYLYIHFTIYVGMGKLVGYNVFIVFRKINIFLHDGTNIRAFSIDFTKPR